MNIFGLPSNPPLKRNAAKELVGWAKFEAQRLPRLLGYAALTQPTKPDKYCPTTRMDIGLQAI